MCIRDRAKIKNIIYKVTTTDTRLQMLQTGEIDMDELTIGQDNVEATEAAGFLSYQYFPTNGYGYMAFNHAKPALKDKVVRQALTTALNREKIVDSVYDQYASVTNINQSKVSWAFYEGKNKYDYDLEKAKKMLDDAGWKPGADGVREKDGVKLSIHFVGTSNNPVVDSILSVATDDWKELGVDFSSEKVDFNQMTAKQKAGDFDMLFMAWGLSANPNDGDISVSYTHLYKSIYIIVINILLTKILQNYLFFKYKHAIVQLLVDKLLNFNIIIHIPKNDKNTCFFTKDK